MWGRYYYNETKTDISNINAIGKFDVHVLKCQTSIDFHTDEKFDLWFQH